MFDINKRKEFFQPTVAEVIEALSELPKDTKVYFNGCHQGYLHVEKNRNVCSFDDSALEEDYEEE